MAIETLAAYNTPSATTLSLDELAQLKLRLALEGIECEAPVYGNLVQIRHPRYGTTHFNSWGTVHDHLNENWKSTYWGVTFHGVPVRSDPDVPAHSFYCVRHDGVGVSVHRGDLDAPVHTDSSSGGVPLPYPV